MHPGEGRGSIHYWSCYGKACKKPPSHCNEGDKNYQQCCEPGMKNCNKKPTCNKGDENYQECCKPGMKN